MSRRAQGSLVVSVTSAPVISQVFWCSKLQHNNFETLEEVLQYYPRLHRDCQLEMQDGEYATLVGSITKNRTIHKFSMSIMILEFLVQPGVLASLSGQSLPPGTSTPICTEQALSLC